MPALVRRPLPLVLAVALVASVLLAVSLSPSLSDRSTAAPSGGAGVRMDHIPSPNQTVVYPTNAAKVFRWGREKWSDEFEVGGLRKDWVNSKQGRVKTQSGMLTVMATGKNYRVTTSPNSVRSRYGRWEARVRIRETNHDGRQYRGYWELIPTKNFKCGAKSIVLASYKRGQRKATGAVRVPPNRQYGYSKRVNLNNGWFHTYAVEITRDHISWFVDTRVIHTERRDDALRGIEYRPRFRLQGVKGKKHRTTWLQMDWVRHYDLSRPNAKSIKAPRMKKGIYNDPC
jgi:hypothetical protein